MSLQVMIPSVKNIFNFREFQAFTTIQNEVSSNFSEVVEQTYLNNYLNPKAEQIPISSISRTKLNASCSLRSDSHSICAGLGLIFAATSIYTATPRFKNLNNSIFCAPYRVDQVTNFLHLWHKGNYLAL